MNLFGILSYHLNVILTYELKIIFYIIYMQEYLDHIKHDYILMVQQPLQL